MKPVKPQKECPFCKPGRKRPDPWRESQCTLNKPLWMVIPPGGVHLSCPVHPEGHHVFGPQVTWMGPADKFPGPNLPEREDNLPDPWDKPWDKMGYYDPSDQKFRCDYEHDPSKDLTYDSTKPYGTATGSGLNGRVTPTSNIWR
jgi:hypothetical protein